MTKFSSLLKLDRLLSNLWDRRDADCPLLSYVVPSQVQILIEQIAVTRGWEPPQGVSLVDAVTFVVRCYHDESIMMVLYKDGVDLFMNCTEPRFPDPCEGCRIYESVHRTVHRY